MHGGVWIYVLAGLIIFVAHLVSAVSGFGSGVLGLPLLALVIGLEPGKQSMLLLGVALYGYLCLRWLRQIDWRELLLIVVLSGIGLFVGMGVVASLNQRVSTISLAIFIILVGLRGALNVAPGFRTPVGAARALVFLGGIVHGAFTTGGPLITVYCQRALPHKSTFRATLSALWLLLGIGLIIGWTIGGRWDPATWRITLLGLPFVAAGLALGEHLHHRIDEREFRRAVNFTLIAVGLVLLLSAFK